MLFLRLLKPDGNIVWIEVSIWLSNLVFYFGEIQEFSEKKKLQQDILGNCLVKLNCVH